ncbi:hypothetical protein GUY40_26810 [Pseudomonas sp. R5(2019)]|nr:hypothetical protein [Pseudomonas sp. R5(2019)]
MNTLNKLLLAMVVMGSSAVTQASESTFAGLAYGQTSDKVKKSGLLNDNLQHPNADGIIRKDGTWGLRVGAFASRPTEPLQRVALQMGRNTESTVRIFRGGYPPLPVEFCRQWAETRQPTLHQTPAI